ncbi:MAG: glycosyl transferase family 1 [Burkholderiales bacterium RIFCSPLOWO2_12_FULL_61_40]|nr:MAG: glycosyl transferase family 1 [Burkholderiales bacterium RIFCSPLOWO2_12_FULL_61_40]
MIEASIIGKRLRIAVLNRDFLSTGGGAERYSIALVEQLAQRHEMHVFAQNINHEFPGVTYHKIWMPLRRPRWVNQLWYAAATWWATRRGFDVVHSHENTWHGQVQTVHVLPIKYTLFHSRTAWRLALRWFKVVTSPRLLVYLWLEHCRYSMHGNRRVVVTSTSLQAIMAQTYPAVVQAMVVVTPGVSNVPGPTSTTAKRAARTRLGLPLEGKCVLFVGNDYQKKGLAALIEALRQLPDNVFLVVVGNAAQIPAFRDRVNASGVGLRVFFLGAMKDVSDAYCAADCLTHPTLEDTFAMVVLEAMAHGVPVVVSNASYCGISGLLCDGVQALILNNPRDPADIANGIKKALFDDALKEALVLAGVSFVGAYLWSEIAAQQEQIYLRSVCTDTQ